MTAVATLRPQVDRHETELRSLSELVKCHERELYGEHDMPGLVKEFEEIKKVVPAVKLWIGVLSFMAAICGGSLIAFIWAIITHTVEIVH
jgi:hypothetical protein